MKPLPALTLAAGLLTTVAAAAGALAIYSGAYNVSATTQHWQPVYTLLSTTLRYSVQMRARHIETPMLTDPQRIASGALLFNAKCVQCHGAPGVAPGDIGKSMQPLPGPLVDALQRWRPREIYWLTRHGIKMSGMPAWEFRLSDAQMWDVVAFVQHMPGVTPQAYAQAIEGSLQVGKTAASPSMAVQAINRPADAARGKQAMYQYACITCHTIPGVVGSSPNVGPPLAGLARRTQLAGRLDNTRDNLVRWLRYPQAVKPLTAMPDLGVTESDARDMAAFLATLH